MNDHGSKKNLQILEALDGRSTLYEKLSPDQRRRLDQAIIDRDPPSYRGAYAKLRLADLGIGFYAFYRYARKLRLNAEMLHLAELTLPDQAELSAALPKLLGLRLLDLLLYEESAPRTIQRLTSAYASAVQSHLLIHQQDLVNQAIREKAADRHLHEINNLVKDHVRTLEQDLKSTSPTPNQHPPGATHGPPASRAVHGPDLPPNPQSPMPSPASTHGLNVPIGQRPP